MRLCLGVSLSHWWVGSLFEADPRSLIWIQARLPSWVPEVTGSHPEKIFFGPGIHLFNQFFAAWSSIYSRMVEFQQETLVHPKSCRCPESSQVLVPGFGNLQVHFLGPDG